MLSTASMDVIRRLRDAAQAGAKRRVLLIALVGLTAGACGGTESGAPLRRTVIDSRDSYDPRSLDPAFGPVTYASDRIVHLSPTPATGLSTCRLRQRQALLGSMA